MSATADNPAEHEPATPGAAPGDGARDAEVAVVGAGIAGLIAAWRAANAGASVTVLDDSGSRAPASAVAAGMIAPVGEASWGEERLLQTAFAAAEQWPAFAAELEREAGIAVPYRRCGSLHLALDRDEAAELARRHELHAGLGLASETVLPSEARRLEPGLSTAVTAAVTAPREAEVDPRAVLAALRAAAERAGAAVVAGRAARIERSGEASVIGLAGGGTVRARRVFLAAGAWNGDSALLGDGLRLPIRPVKGEIVRLRADPGSMPCERIILGERFYVVPRLSGEVVIGATVEECGFETTVSAGGVHELLREAYRALPELAELEFVEAAAGLRPGSPDNAPIIGPLAGPGEQADATAPFALAGLYRNGVLLAPLLAAAVDASLAGQPLPQALMGLGWERFRAVPGPGAGERAQQGVPA